MALVLLLLFVAVPIAELAIFVVVSGQIGLGATILVVIVTAVIGASLVRAQGLAVMAQFRRELSMGGFPGRQLAHGAMVLIGGALLLTPGFLTDAIGFSLMVPPVREVIRKIGERYVKSRTIIIR